jgi:DNA-binding MurR/RpiR family transcriptional regulator
LAADYLLENRNDITFATLEELAAKIGVSTTTVIRLARTLGYGGYSEMQKGFQYEVMEKVSLPERLSTSGSLTMDKLMEDTIKNDIKNISETVAGLSDSLMKDAVDMISAAGNVYILGMRSSFALSHYTASRLGQIRPNVRLIQSAGMIFPEELVGCGEKDVCIAFMFSRYSKTTANLLKWMKSMKVKVILFTNPKSSAIKDYGDLFIPCHVKGVSFKNSFAAPISVINYLAAATALENQDTAVETLRKTEDFLNRGYYLGL